MSECHRYVSISRLCAMVSGKKNNLFRNKKGIYLRVDSVDKEANVKICGMSA